MKELFLDQPPWWVAGPVLGLCVVAMYATLNARLGVVGAISDVVERVSERSVRLGWKGSFALGLLGGAVLFTLATGRERVGEGYGWLTHEFSGATTVVLLLLAGVAIGYGTKTAGGCTSGNGLSGNAVGSRASLVATAVFFGAAVAVSLATKWVFGT